jgi:phenylacetate-CoA ligase
MSPFEVLKKLPFLSKETFRCNPTVLLTQKSPRGTEIFHSGGTTGNPTQTYYSPHFHKIELAVAAARSLSWAGVGYKDRRVMFGYRKICHPSQSSPPYWRFNPAENMAYGSVYHMSKKTLPHYIEFLRAFKPKIIMGYPAILRLIADYALDNNDLPAPANAIITTSETLFSTERDLIEAAWGCKVFDRYGAVENCVFVSQCEFGRYHISPEVGIVEIVDEHGNITPPGILGEIICTGLQNFLQPLIRYRIGDLARWAVEQNCPCGREMPIIEGIEGRVEEMCFTPDGRQINQLDCIFEGVKNILEAQVIQDAIDHFILLVVPKDGFGAFDIKLLEQNMNSLVSGVTLDVRIVDKVSRTNAGKLRTIICDLPQDVKDSLQGRH